MLRGLTTAIAWRWLRSKKSHGAANAIAVVAIVGVAVATAAIVCVLSVFNGFREVLISRLDTLTPEAVVLPVKGKVIQNGDSLAEILSQVKGIERALPVVEEQALAIFQGREMPITLKGVPEDKYKGMTGLDSIIIVGTPEIHPGEIDYEDVEATIHPSGVISIGTGVRMGNILPGQGMLIFAPHRTGQINMANPLASFEADSLIVNGVFEAKQSDFDRDMVIVSLSTARDLLLYDSQAEKVELKFTRGSNVLATLKAVRERIGNEFVVKDRLQQQEINFKMVSIEKWVTFLLLFFILVIASFNIVSAMTMFVIDKRDSMSTLYSLGMSSRRIGSIFGKESVMVTMAGTIAGILFGLVLCLLQEKYGFIKLSGEESNLVLSSYPVKVKWSDIAIIFVPAVIISLATAATASGFARRRLLRGSEEKRQ